MHRHALLFAFAVLPSCGSDITSGSPSPGADAQSDATGEASPPDATDVIPDGAADTPPTGPFGAFTILEGASKKDFAWSPGAGQLVFCKKQSDGPLWIRFAEQTASDGENGPHVDIDVCGSASGDYAPMDGSSGGCSGAKTFDVWWHPNGTSAYTNRADASPCKLTLTASGSALAGTFACTPLVSEGGAKVSIAAGSFRCTVTG